MFNFNFIKYSSRD